MGVLPIFLTMHHVRSLHSPNSAYCLRPQISNFYYPRCGAKIVLKIYYFRGRSILEALPHLPDNLHLCPSESVDCLSVIAYRGELSRQANQSFDQLLLYWITVLYLINDK